jgi:hypothetical protein
MKWECTECGGLVERLRPPAKCRHCGQAGIYFVPADVGDRTDGWDEPDELRAAWVRAGLDRPRSGGARV